MTHTSHTIINQSMNPSINQSTKHKIKYLIHVVFYLAIMKETFYYLYYVKNCDVIEIRTQFSVIQRNE